MVRCRSLLFQPLAAAAEPLRCDLTKYKATAGLTATLVENLLAVTWRGERGAELRARYAIVDGRPQIRDLAVRKLGAWQSLGENLTPEYQVASGIRRMTTQQADPLRAAGVELTPEVIAKNRWYAFWDAPLFFLGLHRNRRVRSPLRVECLEDRGPHPRYDEPRPPSAAPRARCRQMG